MTERSSDSEFSNDSATRLYEKSIVLDETSDSDFSQDSYIDKASDIDFSTAANDETSREKNSCAKSGDNTDYNFTQNEYMEKLLPLDFPSVSKTKDRSKNPKYTFKRKGKQLQHVESSKRVKEEATNGNKTSKYRFKRRRQIPEEVSKHRKKDETEENPDTGTGVDILSMAINSIGGIPPEVHSSTTSDEHLTDNHRDAYQRIPGEVFERFSQSLGEYLDDTTLTTDELPGTSNHDRCENVSEGYIDTQELNELWNMISELKGNINAEELEVDHGIIDKVDDVNNLPCQKGVHVNTHDRLEVIESIDMCLEGGNPGKNEASVYNEVCTSDSVQSGRGDVEAYKDNANVSNNGNGSNNDVAANESDNSFNITRRDGRMNKKFNVRESVFSVTLKPSYRGNNWGDHLDTLGNALQEVLDSVTPDLSDGDLISLVINQQGLNAPIVIPLGPKSEMTVSNILKAIENVLQSYQTLAFDVTFEILFTVVAVPIGGTGKKIINVQQDINNKRSIVTIGNTDQMCLARALVVALYKIRKDPGYRYVTRGNRPKHGKLATELCRKAGVDSSKPACLTDVPKFEKAMGMMIRVVSADTMNGFIYKSDLKDGKSIKSDKILYVYFHDNHFDTIVNISAFFGARHFCHLCIKPIQNLDGHKCAAICKLCNTFVCVENSVVSTTPRSCNKCNRICVSEECYDRHLFNKTDVVTGVKLPSVCEKYWKCMRCKAVILRPRKPNHKCGEKYCRDCTCYYLDDQHRCFMRPIPAEKPRTRYIFLDIECSQDSGIHVPNFAVAHRICGNCIDIEDIETVCKTCTKRKYIFKGANTKHELCKWLFSTFNEGFTVICHNLRSYDGMFLLNYLVKNSVKPDVIFNGSKIMYIHVSSVNIRVIDSLNHMPLALAKLPKAFGFESMKKGAFCHFFNTDENQHYIGPIPDIKYYGVDNMFQEERERFLLWHKEQRDMNVEFNFQKEIAAYCDNDVDVLRRCALKFRRLILQVSLRPVKDRQPHGVDPFNYISIASVCFALFRHCFLKPNLIARVPSEGITSGQFSRISILWLEWIMHKARQEGRQLNIQHGMNGREKMIGHYRVDGFHASTKTVYSFLGDYFHGCKYTYSPDTFNYKCGKTMGQLYDKTKQRQQKLEEWGYKVVSIWECEFNREIEGNDELKQFISEQEIPERLNPKDAFYGGRVNATKLFYSVKEGEQIHYSDFCSLYPHVQKTGQYPVGYPEVITSNFKNVKEYVGFAKVKVLPPRGLYHPVLPYRVRGKLMFPLCRTCCTNGEYTCNHSNEQRAFVGTYVTLELIKAVELGYVVLKIYEVYHFPTTMSFNPETHTPGLFTKYINTFLKIKQESSGFPDWVETENDKLKYIQDYKSHEGISLSPSKIAKKPGLRYISKALLVRLWGKMGQRSDRSQTTFIVDIAEFYDLYFDQSKSLKNVHMMTDNVIMVEWAAREGFTTTVQSSNVYIAAFTTAMGRLKLYSILEMLGTRVLYMDTDSVLYSCRVGQQAPPLGDYLGDLTNELAPGEFITQWASGGCKNYVFYTSRNTQVCKVRGFSLNYKNSKVINFKTVSDMVQNIHSTICSCRPRQTACKVCSPFLRVTDTKICRDKKKLQLFNRVENRDYRVCYDKRVILDDLDTIPYGF